MGAEALAASSAWTVGAALSAFAAGCCALLAFRARAWRSAVRRASRVRDVGESDALVSPPHDVDGRLLALAETASRKIALGLRKAPRWGLRSAEAQMAAHAEQAGLGAAVSAAGFCAARRDATAAALLTGAFVGAVFSVELTAVLTAAGAFAGWRALPRALRRRKAQRADELERHLSEMLETVALGLRSGLSFDRSLELYGEHFDTLLAESCRYAQRRWQAGLVTREEGLRALSASYDSATFSRVVETIVRSLRFGSSLAESLEEAASQARASYRARKQEQVAKAPVKMMVPVGTLMLPAMLLLVLGPVLLELMEGF